ncbi:excitatory amino acid transporter 2 [Moniliophthora roreri MCA 2997]|uniref:Amino acid transporter n=1 Tax=Moniliophthora roreri (strain MCA 2997) TaxID=1381753 RepID=V2XHS9_MONRO|nr:excitatory amino acid transporter 2 [Moniliophthora roreri MCA 2997]KAI3607077.1 excitatory amino acid transporter 2 [Moniliophthora roreri]
MSTEPMNQSKSFDEDSETKAPTEQQTSLDTDNHEIRTKKPWWYSVKEPGSALQIVIAAVLAIAIGMTVVNTTSNIPEAATAIVGIPGRLWLRSLQAVVLPLIVCSMIVAVQKLKEISAGGHTLARWTIGFYIVTTIIAVAHSTILVSLVWRHMYSIASGSALQVSEDDVRTIEERKDTKIHDVVVQMFDSLIPSNIVMALAENELLAVLVCSVIVGYLIKGSKSTLLRAVHEIEDIIMVIITFLIKLAPIGVFFLILPNLFRLNMEDIGRNLGILIGSSIASMFIHLFIVLPALFFLVTRREPYSYWFKCAPAWITAWGTASSAATMSVTMKEVRERGLSETVCKFTIPLGTLVNMDGTAIYFPATVVFMAATQGITLNAAEYVIVILLSSLASIGATPIPSSSLVLTVMICTSVGVPITGMYAVVVAIDWFLDRFRTAVNVSGDLYGTAIIAKLSKIPDDAAEDHEVLDNSDRV